MRMYMKMKMKRKLLKLPAPLAVSSTSWDLNLKWSRTKWISSKTTIENHRHDSSKNKTYQISSCSSCRPACLKTVSMFLPNLVLLVLSSCSLKDGNHNSMNISMMKHRMSLKDQDDWTSKTRIEKFSISVLF